MAIERSEFLEVLKDSYSAYYNIVESVEQPEDLPLEFRADYFSRAEKYWLSKNIPVWGNETNEYAYIFSAPSIDGVLTNRCIDFALADALPKVKPHKEHQYTNVKVIFVVDRLEDEAKKAICKRNFTKNYKFSFHGFSTLLTAAVDMEEQKAYTNKAGHELAKYFGKLFAVREK